MRCTSHPQLCGAAITGAQTGSAEIRLAPPTPSAAEFEKSRRLRRLAHYVKGLPRKLKNRGSKIAKNRVDAPTHKLNGWTHDNLKTGRTTIATVKPQTGQVAFRAPRRERRVSRIRALGAQLSERPCGLGL